MGRRIACLAAVLLTAAVVRLAAGVAGQLPPPHFKAVLLCHTDDGKAQCDALSVMNPFEGGVRDATTTGTSGPQGAVAAVTWTYRGHKDGKDVYHIACKFPVGGDHETTSETDVEFDGTRTVVFKGEHLLVAVELQTPPRASPTSRP